MPLTQLADTIRTVRSRIRDHHQNLSKNETRTRLALINPILNQLGWDTSDPQSVTPEYEVGNLKADYALLRTNGAIAAIIEAKKLGENLLIHLDQLRQCCLKTGAPYGVLTDGNHWHIYRIAEYQNWDQGRDFIQLTHNAAPTAAMTLITLWKTNLLNQQTPKTDTKAKNPPSGPAQQMTIIPEDQFQEAKEADDK